VTWPTDEPGFWFRRRFSIKDFNVAATTANFDMLVPGGVRITRAFMSLVTVFAGGSISAATLSVGSTGSPATYLGATNVFTGATAGGAATIAAGAGLGNFVGGNATPTAVGTIRVQLLTTTDNASSLATGKADLFLALESNSVRTT
jgi:hypothetical protein